MNNKLLTKNLRRSLLAYQSILQGPHVPIKEAVWEFVLSHAATKSGMRCDWTPSSHKSGCDMSLDGIRYSCKTSRIEVSIKKGLCADHTMVSSYRLTKYAKDQDPTDLIKEIDEIRTNFDCYALLARESVKTKVAQTEHIRKYKIYSVPASKLKAKRLEWYKQSNGNWMGMGTDYSMTIHKSMAWQLWMKVPLCYIEEDQVQEVDVYDSIKALDLCDLYTSLYKS